MTDRHSALPDLKPLMDDLTELAERSEPDDRHLLLNAVATIGALQRFAERQARDAS